MPRTTARIRIATATASVALVAVASLCSAGTVQAAPAPTAVATPSWDTVKAVKEIPKVAAKQAAHIKVSIQKVDTKLDEARAAADKAAADLIEVRHELPAEVKKAAVASNTDVANLVATSEPTIAPAPSVAKTPAATPAPQPTEATKEPTPAEKLAAAEAAQAAAEQEVATQVVQVAELEAKLTFLTEETPADTAAIQAAAVKKAAKIADADAKKRLADQEAKKVAEEEAAKAAAAAAAEAARLAAIEAARWADPATGRISDTYGPREIICGSDGCSSPFHSGTDVATGCGAPIYAAHTGTVVYAGPNGTLGNWVQIAHDPTYATGYAHMVDGGILVSVGQQVTTGQQIGWTGTTGASSGCHLHFEVYQNGTRIDPQPFMAALGANIG